MCTVVSCPSVLMNTEIFGLKIFVLEKRKKKEKKREKKEEREREENKEEEETGATMEH